MNEHAKAAWEKTKEAGKEISALAGDVKKQASEKLDKAKGDAAHVAENVKDAAHDAKEDMKK
jgi:uncharacterized protein YjbJ (UPF0337 family)